MRKSILFLFGITFFIVAAFTLYQKTYAYTECETGNYTACNTDGSKTGHVMNVTKTGSGYSCQDLGAQPSCVQQICGSTIRQYNECGDNTGGPCDNGGAKQLITVSFCSSSNKYYCWNQGAKPGCGLPNNTPTPTPKPTSAAPTNTPTPAVDPTPTETPQTKVTVVLGLPGIGYDGNTPKHTTRDITVELYGPDVKNPGGPGTKVLATEQGAVTYDDQGDNNAGYFVSKTPISFPNLPTSEYQILIKVQQYLYKLAINASNSNSPTVFSLSQGTTTILDPVILIPGNVDTSPGHANTISILDWNAIISCYGANATTGSCPSPIRPPSAGDLNLADLNDDGVVDIADLNLWLRSWQLLVSNNAPGCSTGSCQGD